MPKEPISTWLTNLKDPKSAAVKEALHRVGNLNTTLLIYGETGVGKDFWADYLHRTYQYPHMVNLNCGDVPENLLESEWFGYARGAFSGAHQSREGKWSGAEGGILFLNRIDLLSLNLQSKLLRIIERKKYFPLGSNRETDVNARFIFSTDADIRERVREGTFREDLYYRISAYRILVPPLRERRKDIMPLLTYFAREGGVTVDLTPEGRNVLLNYPWHGNIRELQNFVTNISIRKNTITDPDAFPLLETSRDFLESMRQREMTMYELEREYIHYMLRKYKNKVKVAKLLGIARKSLYNKLEAYQKEEREKEDREKE